MKRWQKLFLWSLVFIALCAALYQRVTRGMEHVLAQADLNVRPFVSEQVHYWVKDGAEVVVVRETVARSRSGAVVHAGTLYQDGKEYTGLRRIEYPDGFVGLVIDSIKGKSTAHPPDEIVAASKLAMENTPKDCAEPPFYVIDGEETLAGQRAVRIMGTNPDQLSRFVTWRLPDYNCETVQGAMQKRSSPTAEWQTIAGSHLIKFVEIDPDPALFSGFASYSEMPPTALAKRYFAQRGSTVPDCPKCKDVDQVYRDWNK